MKKHILSFIAGAAAVLLIAASGDLIYIDKGETFEISSGTALCFAQCGISASPQALWTGSQADMIRCTAQRDNGSSTGFSGSCMGERAAPPGSLPVPSEVIGVVP